jgi:hypothetical protein
VNEVTVAIFESSENNDLGPKVPARFVQIGGVVMM